MCVTIKIVLYKLIWRDIVNKAVNKDNKSFYGKFSSILSGKDKTFKRGIHPASSKLTRDMPLTEYPTPKTVYIALSQHIGAPAEAVVAPGDKVKAGTLIAKAKGFVSGNIYSSVSGTVKKFVMRPNAQGMAVNHVEIENDGLYESENLIPLGDDADKDAIIARIQEAGIVGMGGATFPTHVKLKPSKPVDTLIINAAECEPYITCDMRLMLDNGEDVVEGIMYLKKALGVDNVYIGIETNKPEAIAHMEELVKDKPIDVVRLKPKYPQGAEKQLIYAVTKRKVPAGGLPMDAGVVVDNLHTAYSVARAVKYGEPLYMRAMTVTGQGVEKKGNYWVRNGVPYSDIYDECKGNAPDNIFKVISGGPMMGFAQSNLDSCTTKGASSLIFVIDGEMKKEKISACINCARCANTCPMKVMPMFVERAIDNGDIKTAVRYGALNCIECGSCAFVCPAKRPLVQSCRLTKRLAKEKGVK